MKKDKKEIENLQKRFEEAIDLVIEEAKAQGLSVYQWLEKHYKDWDEKTIIDGLYEDFMNMYINGVVSEISGKVPQSFEEYLNDSLKAIEYRLKALEYNKKYQTSGFEPLKKIGIIEQIEGLPKGFGEPLKAEDIDFFEMILKKTKETIENYLKRRE